MIEALPEKALLDWIYLSRKTGEGLWLDIDPSRLNRPRLHEFAKRFPATVRRAALELTAPVEASAAALRR